MGTASLAVILLGVLMKYLLPTGEALTTGALRLLAGGVLLLASVGVAGFWLRTSARGSKPV